MAFDYSEFVDVADDLINEFGRDIRLMNTTRAPANTNEPWKGPSSWDDASAPDQQLVTVKAVFIGRGMPLTQGSIAGSRAGRDGETLTQSELDIFLISGSTSINPKDFDRAVDINSVWSISSVVTIQPGDTPVLYVLEVHQ